MEMGRSDNRAEAALGLGGIGCVDAAECRQAPVLEQVLEQLLALELQRSAAQSAVQGSGCVRWVQRTLSDPRTATYQSRKREWQRGKKNCARRATATTNH
jgi:hypothetical protein